MTRKLLETISHMLVGEYGLLSGTSLLVNRVSLYSQLTVEGLANRTGSAGNYFNACLSVYTG